MKKVKAQEIILSEIKKCEKCKSMMPKNINALRWSNVLRGQDGYVYCHKDKYKCYANKVLKNLKK